ncbi:MAG: macro domain-containing protein, partial [Anaerolineae bacterium]
MPDVDRQLRTEFRFGTSVVSIVQGNILDPPIDQEVEALVSTDDNYLTMGSGFSRLLMTMAGSEEYIRAAQAECPVEAGAAVITGAYGIADHVPGVKHVLHGAVIDYDTDELSLEQLVYRTTTNCLRRAEERGIKSILFPAFATGSGELSMAVCARQMCDAIKAYLAQERRLKRVYVILFRPDEDDEDVDPATVAEWEARNQRFIREANLVLDVPYDPSSGVRQCRDFYGREKELERLEEIITGQLDDEVGKRPVVILGGPAIGKQALLDQITCRARQPDSPLGEGRRIVKVTFGRVHSNTPASFVYRKFLCALGEDEEDEEMQELLKSAYANPKMDSKQFIALLEGHSDRYPDVVFLVDHLPKLLKIELGEAENDESVLAFWKDLDRLQERVRFVCTAREDQYDELQQKRLKPATESFHERIALIRLQCVSEAEREGWIDALFERYLHRAEGAPDFVHQFVRRMAGQHPYLISLLGYALVEGLKRDALMGSDPVEVYNQATLKPFLQAAAEGTERSRRIFFNSLLTDKALGELERQNLKNLARAVADEEERQWLLSGLEREEPDAVERWQALLAQDNPRLSLDQAVLKRLERWGYLVNADDRSTAQLMARPFAAWLEEHYRLGDRRQDQPQDVMIGFLNPEPHVVATLFGERGARLLSA